MTERFSCVGFFSPYREKDVFPPHPPLFCINFLLSYLLCSQCIHWNRILKDFLLVLLLFPLPLFLSTLGLIAATPIASTVAEASSDGALHFYAGDNALWILLAYCVEQAGILGIGFPSFRDADMSFDTYVQVPKFPIQLFSPSSRTSFVLVSLFFLVEEWNCCVLVTKFKKYMVFSL